jgi:hypothetical protein
MNQIKLTSFHESNILDFFNKLKIVCGKSALKHTGTKIIKKKYTILKSPHVNKKARDQIEIKHISHFFKSKNLFFLLYWKQYNNLSLQLSYKHFYSQKVFIL